MIGVSMVVIDYNVIVKVCWCEGNICSSKVWDSGINGLLVNFWSIWVIIKKFKLVESV